MKRRTIFAFSLAAASFALLSPNSIPAQDTSSQGAGMAATPAAQQEAAAMSPAQAELVKGLDARKVQSGTRIRARLTDTVHLKDGRELPHGTRLTGTVTADSVQSGTASRLALRFTQAELKDGKTIPIAATIVGVAPPIDSMDSGVASDISTAWDGRTTQVDQQSVMSGVDLHSRIGGDNSGVFVAAGKDDVKLAVGSRLALAIGDQTGTTNVSGTSGGY